jgi:hypothetical protein
MNALSRRLDALERRSGDTPVTWPQYREAEQRLTARSRAAFAGWVRLLATRPTVAPDLAAELCRRAADLSAEASAILAGDTDTRKAGDGATLERWCRQRGIDPAGDGAGARDRLRAELTRVAGSHDTPLPLERRSLVDLVAEAGGGELL